MPALERSACRAAAVAVFVLAAIPACRSRGGTGSTPAPSASAPFGLAPDLAGRTLAKVGDRSITLAEYATVLARMDRFERLRYQTADRRKQLLDEMINVELLAAEAERRGLSNRPETKELERQILRDAVIQELRDKAPAVADIPQGEVRTYYDTHRADFKEPERRRISHVAVRDRATAERVLSHAKGSNAKAWGELVQKYSIDKPPADAPLELAGDLGFVTPPSFGKNDNGRVPEPVRAAAFEVQEPETTVGRVVEDGGRFHVVRVTGTSAPRDRTFEEAERTIRVKLLEEKLRAAEAELEKTLRERYPVEIDQAALSKVAVPAADEKPR
jgi:parvulin-like peptidyl-prolyl isomerase